MHTFGHGMKDLKKMEYFFGAKIGNFSKDF
jgi:hypothetical protein